MGAAGLTSSSVEMAARGGLGIAIDLDQVPKREANLSPYEILLSESQERMLIVARAGAEDEVMEIFAKWDLDAVGDRRGHRRRDAARPRRAARRSSCLPIEPLAHGAPVYERPVRAAGRSRGAASASTSTSSRCRATTARLLLRLLDSPNIASQALGVPAVRLAGAAATPSSARAPTRPCCASRARNKALALSVDCNSRYCLLDPYVGAMIAVVESGAQRRLQRRASRSASPTASTSAIPRSRRSCGSSAKRCAACATPARRWACRS